MDRIMTKDFFAKFGVAGRAAAAAFALAPSDQEKLTREFPERRLVSEAVPLR